MTASARWLYGGAAVAVCAKNDSVESRQKKKKPRAHGASWVLVFPTRLVQANNESSELELPMVVWRPSG